MKVRETDLDGVLLIEPDRFVDSRGFFIESFRRDRYQAAGITDDFVQDNHSRSGKGVLRGLHFQVRRPQAQLVTVMRGRIFDVAIDLRRQSRHFGHWFGTELADDGVCQIYTPPGFAHGFYVISDFADLHYKVSRTYDGTDEGGIVWNDPDIGIAWPNVHPILSPRDAAYPKLDDISPDNLPHLP